MQPFGGAAPPGDDGCRVAGRLAQDVLRRPAPDGAVHPSVFRRNRTLDQQNVLAGEVGNRVVQTLFRLESGQGLQRLRVIQRDRVQQNIGDDRVRRTDEGLTAAGAFLEVKPDHRRARLALKGVYDLQQARGLDSSHSGGEFAETQKIPPRVTLALHEAPNVFGGVRHENLPP